MADKAEKKRRALVIVDLQNDFLPGGSLEVRYGDAVVPLINMLLDMPFEVKVATKDWHPKEHGSFAANHLGRMVGDVVQLDGIDQILWPIHCVQETEGSEFTPDLNKEPIEKVFFKGTEENIDSYSTFFDNEHLKSTGLGEYLKEKKIKEVYLAGLATDYCVKYSALDAVNLGFNTFVVIDACRGVNLLPDDSEKAIEEMQDAGAKLISFKDLSKKMSI